MPELIDGFTVERSWVELGEGKFYPCIGVRMTKADGTVLSGYKNIHSVGPFNTSEKAGEAAKSVPVLGVATDGVGVIIKVDAL